MKTILKWMFRIGLTMLVLLVLLLLFLDTIMRVTIQNRIHAQTGMTAEIGEFDFGLIDSSVRVRDFKLRNSADFGGTPFADISEIYVEYDRAALANGELRCALVRFNLTRLDIVKNAAGKTNIVELGLVLPTKISPGTNSWNAAAFKKQTGFDFKGIGNLNVTVGEVRFVDLKDPRYNRAQKVGIDNLVMTNILKPDDLAGLAAAVVLRSGGILGPPLKLK